MSILNWPFLSDGTVELTDDDLMRLSEKVTSKMELRKLCVTGFEMDGFVVERIIRDNPEIDEAAYKLLSDWFKGQDSRKTAFKKLCAALRTANMNVLASELMKGSKDVDLCQAESGQDIPLETTHGDNLLV